MTRRIRDTDVVYSAVSVDGNIRFALRRAIHSRSHYSSVNGRQKPPFKFRVAYTPKKYQERWRMYESCLSMGYPSYCGHWEGKDNNDGWLDWLAKGEDR